MTERIGAQHGIWIIDAEGHTTYINESMAEILGVSRSEVLGQSSFDYIFPEDLDAARRLFAAKKDGHIGPFGFKLRRKDGSEVFVEVQGTPLFDGSGGFKGVVGTFTISR